MKVLNIGCHREYTCNDPAQTFAGQEIEMLTLDVDPGNNPDYLQDITKPIPEEMRGQFDVVYMSHVLEHVARAELMYTIANCHELLKPGGKLYVFVPCIEWACSEVLKGNEDTSVHGAIYGGQQDEWDLHKAGFTLNALKRLLKGCDFFIETSGVGYYIGGTQRSPRRVLQNIAVGVKGESYRRLDSDTPGD